MCLSYGSLNDFGHWWHRDYSQPNRSPYGENRCEVFREAQGKTCDCVPTEKWEATLQERIESHFAAYAPSLLNKGKGQRQEDVESMARQASDDAFPIFDGPFRRRCNRKGAIALGRAAQKRTAGGVVGVVY